MRSKLFPRRRPWLLLSCRLFGTSSLCHVDDICQIEEHSVKIGGGDIQAEVPRSIGIIFGSTVSSHFR